MTAAVDSEDVRRTHVRVNHALVDAHEMEIPISQERAGRLYDVQLGEARPDVVLVEHRFLHDGAVVLGVTLVPDLGDVACEGVGEARARQCR